jgi:hypothetical protein
MAAVKTKLGRIPCDCCGHQVVLKKNEAGTLTIACDECDISAFAKTGTEASRRWLSKLPKGGAPEPDKKPAAQPPESVPKATPVKPAGVFDFLNTKGS